MATRFSRAWQLYVFFRNKKALRLAKVILARHQARCFGGSISSEGSEQSYYVPKRLAFAAATALQCLDGIHVKLFWKDPAEILSTRVRIPTKKQCLNGLTLKEVLAYDPVLNPPQRAKRSSKRA